MKHNKFWAAPGRALAVVTVTLIVVLMLVPGAWACKYKTLYKFKGGKDGAYLGAGLIFDQAGNLYSTTNLGGAYGYGTVFQLTPNGDGSWTERVLHSFNGTDGNTPTSASLIFDQSGRLYATTNQGGAYGYGTVFQLTPNGDGSWTESVLHSFSGTDGSKPIAGLIFDGAGNLYGTTTAGGAYDSGTVFELTPNGDGTWTENVIHSFSGGDGSSPTANLIFDSAGNLYGTTLYGGDGDGTAFRLAPNGDGSWTEIVLHSFHSADGGLPWWGMIFDKAGNLYGTTWLGGAYGGGTVFRLIPKADGSWKHTVLFSLATNGPASLIRDSVGNLYSTTMHGGTYGYGTVFKLKHVTGGWKEIVLHSFRNRPGAQPFAGVIFDAAGNLYSTTYGDGSTTFGSVFEITP